MAQKRITNRKRNSVRLVDPVTGKSVGYMTLKDQRLWTLNCRPSEPLKSHYGSGGQFLRSSLNKAHTERYVAAVAMGLLD